MADKKTITTFDEPALAKLLEAAYVIQEHRRGEPGEPEKSTAPPLEFREISASVAVEVPQEPVAEAHPPQVEPAAAPSLSPAEIEAPVVARDFSLTLAEIVETQRLMQVEPMPLGAALKLVTDRLVAITSAHGASVGIVHGKSVEYVAASGSSALPVGTTVSMEKALCFAALRTGQPLRCEDVHPEFLLDGAECERRGIECLIAVPIYQDGALVAALELYFAKTYAFTDQDVHTCQLMAGLVTEALTRDAQHSWKQTLTVERASMLEALEKLKPNLAAIAGNSSQEGEAPSVAAKGSGTESLICRRCQHPLLEGEQFCGKCGLARATDYEPPTMQSKVASLWQMQESSKAKESEQEEASLPPDLLRQIAALGEKPPASTPDEAAVPIETELGLVFEKPEHPDAHAGSNQDSEQDAAKIETEEVADAKADEAIVTTANRATWSSAASARAYLERLAANGGKTAISSFWRNRRGDAYLFLAVLLVAAAVRWGIWSQNAMGSASAASNPAVIHKKADPNADLPLYDRILIDVGLAEPPDPVSEPTGNPNTQVWVDLHTALYYCPGTDLYGKTANGKFTTQRDAQMDQFEPAYRKACN